MQQLSLINATSYNPYGDGGPGSVFLDHTGDTLYDDDIYAYGTGDSAYQAFSIDQSTGQLNFLQLGPDGGVNANVPLSFIANNLYAYGASCYEGSGNIFGYKRNSDGTLTALNIDPTIPAAPKWEGAILSLSDSGRSERQPGRFHGAEYRHNAQWGRCRLPSILRTARVT